jgi:hypothetical protein
VPQELASLFKHIGYCEKCRSRSIGKGHWSQYSAILIKNPWMSRSGGMTFCNCPERHDFMQDYKVKGPSTLRIVLRLASDVTYSWNSALAASPIKCFTHAGTRSAALGVGIGASRAHVSAAIVARTGQSVGGDAWRECMLLLSGRRPKRLVLSCADQAGLNLGIRCFALSASRTNGCTQNDKHDCHSNQEAKVILAPVVVHFVHLHILVDE